MSGVRDLPRLYSTRPAKGSGKGGSFDGDIVHDMKQTVANQLAPKYEAGMSKYPLGRYRDRVGVNIEAVYNKSVKKG